MAPKRRRRGIVHEKAGVRPITSVMLSRLRDKLLRRRVSELRAMPQLGELLGRPVVDLHTPQVQDFLGGRRVMVTGAGGSIGSEICRQVARFCPERLVLVERAEPALFEVDRELGERWLGTDVRPALADVTDAARMDRLFAEHRPHVVFHAAAHKHVPLMEANPGEAVKNNVSGTRVVAEAAARHAADAFVLVSTDKAVNPTSVMGASKRLAEMVVQETGSRQQAAGSRKDRYPAPCSLLPAPSRFSAVRFGNVLGSSGSVVPIFRRQIEAGGPVTVTHPQMRRYFMTIPEATQLVLQAGAIGRGGDVMVLDMGEPVRIVDLARRMIAEAGLVEGRDIELRFTGVRPGEKLFEELARDDERTRPTGHPKIRVWELPAVDADDLRRTLADLESVADAPAADVVDALTRAVPEYRPTSHAAPRDREAIAA